MQVPVSTLRLGMQGCRLTVDDHLVARPVWQGTQSLNCEEEYYVRVTFVIKTETMYALAVFVKCSRV